MTHYSHPSNAVKLVLYNGEHWICLRDYLGQSWEETTKLRWWYCAAET